MGWLSKISGFFQSSVQLEEKHGEDVYLQDLPLWLDVFMQNIIARHKLSESVASYCCLLKDKRWMLECRLDEWQKRMSYVRNPYERGEITLIFRDTRKFLELLTFSDDISLAEVLAFNNEVQPELDKLIRRIKKSSLSDNFAFFLRESDSNILGEVNPLMSELMAIEELGNNFEEGVLQSGYHLAASLKANLASMENCSKQIALLRTEMQKRAEKQAFTNEKEREKREEFQKVQGSSSFTSLEQKKELLLKIEEADDFIFSLFSRLRPLLKKYRETVSVTPVGRKLIDYYTEDPLAALIRDDDLIINDLLQHVKALLIKGDNKELAFPVDEVNMFLATLEKIDKDSLKKMQEEGRRMKKDLQELQRAMRGDDSLLKLDEAKYRLEHFARQKEMLEEEISILTQNIAKLSEARAKEKEALQNLLRDKFGKEVNIILD
ncbi:MAG: hypothetical protein AB1668_01110 [Nanoarchaeota archaeon]